MNESYFYVELQDAQGTYYGATDVTGEPIFFEDLDEARMYAKGQCDDTYVLARVINSQTHRVVDYFKR